MAPKVFLTGATGYIGGDLLYNLKHHHPDWEVAALTRSEEKGKKVREVYPDVRIVHGSLDSADIIEEEVKKADIVFHLANCDDAASAHAITKGMSHHTPSSPCFWIHISGTGILTWADFRASTWGTYRPTPSYDDWDHVTACTSIPDDALHREVDKIVLSAAVLQAEVCKTAIVAPPMIYGRGRGPCNRRSMQAYELSKTQLVHKTGFMVGEGTNVWHQVHVQDLSDLFLRLGEQAAAGGGKATWGAEGYYFAENGAFEWGELAKALAREAKRKGYLESEEVISIDGKTADEWDAWGHYMWGTNSLGKAVRGRKLLGWEPFRPSVFEVVPEIVEGEAKALGL